MLLNWKYLDKDMDMDMDSLRGKVTVQKTRKKVSNLRDHPGTETGIETEAMRDPGTTILPGRNLPDSPAWPATHRQGPGSDLLRGNPTHHPPYHSGKGDLPTRYL